MALINSKIKLLEYRGYDSSGFCVIDSKKNEFLIKKTIGTIDKIKNIPDIESYVGISHTRWATHGEPNNKNSHPILSYSKNLAIVHNGIIENYSILKKILKEKGYKFRTDTDTEVLINFIEEIYKKSKSDFENTLNTALM